MRLLTLWQVSIVAHLARHLSVQDCSLSQDVTRRMELKLQRPGSQVSNTDHLFWRDALIMILETSTSSLSFRSSELSQLSEVVSS